LNLSLIFPTARSLPLKPRKKKKLNEKCWKTRRKRRKTLIDGPSDTTLTRSSFLELLRTKKVLEAAVPRKRKRKQ
jgi:hypothetical protein